MSKWDIEFKIEGMVTVEAESEEEARDEFYQLSDGELIQNSFLGTEIRDLKEV